MSLLRRLLARLRLLPRARHTPHPDCLVLRDWADLPAHHPCREKEEPGRSPC